MSKKVASIEMGSLISFRADFSLSIIEVLFQRDAFINLIEYKQSRPEHIHLGTNFAETFIECQTHNGAAQNVQ